MFPVARSKERWLSSQATGQDWSGKNSYLIIKTEEWKKRFGYSNVKGCLLLLMKKVICPLQGINIKNL